MNCVVRPLYKIPSLILHNSCSVDVFLFVSYDAITGNSITSPFIKTVYKIFDINVWNSLHHNMDGYTIEKCINE